MWKDWSEPLHRHDGAVRRAASYKQNKNKIPQLNKILLFSHVILLLLCLDVCFWLEANGRRDGARSARVRSKDKDKGANSKCATAMMIGYQPCNLLWMKEYLVMWAWSASTARSNWTVAGLQTRQPEDCCQHWQWCMTRSCFKASSFAHLFFLFFILKRPAGVKLLMHEPMTMAAYDAASAVASCVSAKKRRRLWSSTQRQPPRCRIADEVCKRERTRKSSLFQEECASIAVVEVGCMSSSTERRQQEGEAKQRYDWAGGPKSKGPRCVS